jgi:hypothetical protein
MDTIVSIAKSEASTSTCKAPNPKLQHPKKLQTSRSKQVHVILLEFGIWNFSGAWNLEFRAFTERCRLDLNALS